MLRFSSSGLYWPTLQRMAGDFLRLPLCCCVSVVFRKGRRPVGGRKAVLIDGSQDTEQLRPENQISLKVREEQTDEGESLAERSSLSSAWVGICISGVKGRRRPTENNRKEWTERRWRHGQRRRSYWDYKGDERRPWALHFTILWLSPVFISCLDCLVSPAFNQGDFHFLVSMVGRYRDTEACFRPVKRVDVVIRCIRDFVRWCDWWCPNLQTSLGGFSSSCFYVYQKKPERKRGKFGKSWNIKKKNPPFKVWVAYYSISLHPPLPQWVNGTWLEN